MAHNTTYHQAIKSSSSTEYFHGRIPYNVLDLKFTNPMQASLAKADITALIDGINEKYKSKVRKHIWCFWQKQTSLWPQKPNSNAQSRQLHLSAQFQLQHSLEKSQISIFSLDRAIHNHQSPVESQLYHSQCRHLKDTVRSENAPQEIRPPGRNRWCTIRWDTATSGSTGARRRCNIGRPCSNNTLWPNSSSRGTATLLCTGKWRKQSTHHGYQWLQQRGHYDWNQAHQQFKTTSTYRHPWDLTNPHNWGQTTNSITSDIITDNWCSASTHNYYSTTFHKQSPQYRWPQQHPPNVVPRNNHLKSATMTVISKPHHHFEATKHATICEATLLQKPIDIPWCCNWDKN